MKHTLAILMLLTLAGLSGCGSQEPSPEQTALTNMKWSYADHAIELNLTATADLNQYNGQAHNLLLVVAQFDNANAFSTYTSSPQQFNKLLLLTAPPTGMIGINRVFITPGQTLHLKLPRLEGSKIIGIAAGYAHLDPLRSAKLYQIGVDLTSKGFFSKTWTATPQPIAIDLLLGPDALLRGQQSALQAPTVQPPQAGELSIQTP
jgi:type VI secretion system VasD/TssJ family lipoprotein